jgi:ABC-2 type transport system permease protein
MIVKILKVARRDFIETVKTKVFLFGVLLVPLLIGGLIFGSAQMQKKSFEGPRPDRQVAIINNSEEIRACIDSVFAKYNGYNTQRKIVLNFSGGDTIKQDARTEELKNTVRNGGLDALLVIDKGVLDNNGSFHLFTKSQMDMEFTSTMQRLTNDAVFNTRLLNNNLSPELINKYRQWVNMEQVDLSGKKESKRNEIAILLMPFFFLMLMFMGIFSISQGLLMSVIEEKTSRVIEVLLASVSPFELMAGKILGQSAVGFTLIGLYGASSYGVLVNRGMGDIINGNIAIYFVVYYILGFLIISSLLAAVGSVCNEIKEAQSLMGPLMMLMVTPMVCWLYIAQHPEGTLATVLSFIPPMTPMIMIMRIAVDPGLPFIQIAGSIALLIVSVPVVMIAAAKVFHTGILMYGKPPSLREIMRWMR